MASFRDELSSYNTMSTFTWPIRVYYEDTDSGGLVFHSNYLNFMERARTEWLRHLGIEQPELRKQKQILFVVRSLNLDYFTPARFNDLLVIESSVEVRKASMVFSQHIFATGAKGAPQGSMLCSGRVKIACVDSIKLRPKVLPSNLFTELK